MNTKLKIEILPAEAPEAGCILLGEMKPGDVVELGNGTTAVVVDSVMAVHAQYKVRDRCLHLLAYGDGKCWHQIGTVYACHAIEGTGPGRIVKVLGKLVGITVKPDDES